MDDLGIRQFFFMGYCIGGPFAMKLMERAHSAWLQPCYASRSGIGRKTRTICTTPADYWAKEFRERRADVPMEIIEKYLHNLYRLRPDFVYSVSRDFAHVPDANACPAGRRCGAPAPDSHRHSFALPECRDHGVSRKDPPELKARTINRVAPS